MSLQQAASRALGSGVRQLRPLSGGYVTDAYELSLDDGRRLFLKTSQTAPSGTFATEAAGLRWIEAAPGGPRVPEIVAVTDPEQEDGEPRFLVLTLIERGPLSLSGAERLGRELAELHRAGAAAHGELPPGRPPGDWVAGPWRMPSEIAPDAGWPEVYGSLRLMPIARMADERGALPPGALAEIDALCERLPELSGPPEDPSRLHGDLWGGNVMADASGDPYLIDPAAYGGHREIDLAMLALFAGGLPHLGRCLAAYDEAFALSDGHTERMELWQLFPLLVHAGLFGGSYGDQAIAVVRRYL